ncbi:MAG: hypothetical protein ACYS76_07950 [Planctomycetota bacterium]|jgi:hypothetical protein
MVRTLLTLIIVLGTIPTAAGQITLDVYEADGQTPFDPNSDLMVGARLTLIVSSDSNDWWSGGLFIRGQDRALGTLAGRDYDPNTRDWTGSHLENAGDFAKVVQWKDSAIWGFDPYTFYPVDGNSKDDSTVTGDWFIFDYYADEVGGCNVELYDYNVSWDDPVSHTTFYHVPTRDLNGDEVVNFADFATLAGQWMAAECADPNWCDGADLDRDGSVDGNDLGGFADYWLWPYPPTQPPEEEPNQPGEPNHPEDPNVIYSILDANDSNEITMDVNDSITLYVKMATTEANNVCTFDIEVNISNPNLSSIDNRARDPNDSSASTARILAQPRDEGFDDWGPGTNQEEGVRFYAASIGSPMSDGNLASFVFTCTGQGDVTLNLINWSSLNTDGVPVFPKLETILIHQPESASQQATGGETTAMSTMQDNTDGLASWLEDAWAQEKEIRETYSKSEWNEFIDSVEDPNP